jgi:hypothetical protein
MTALLVAERLGDRILDRRLQLRTDTKKLDGGAKQHIVGQLPQPRHQLLVPPEPQARLGVVLERLQPRVSVSTRRP